MAAFFVCGYRQPQGIIGLNFDYNAVMICGVIAKQK